MIASPHRVLCPVLSCRGINPAGRNSSVISQWRVLFSATSARSKRTSSCQQRLLIQIEGDRWWGDSESGERFR